MDCPWERQGSCTGTPVSRMPVTVTLSTWGCTKTNVGTLDSLRAVAVTCARPVAPGVQVVKATSQCPAQATPLAATFTMAVSLDEKVIGTLRFVPVAVCADAVKKKVAPNSTEVLLLGVRLTFPGKSGGPALAPLPQPLMLRMLPREKSTDIANRETFELEPPLQHDLPMHPSCEHCSGTALILRFRNYAERTVE